VVINNEKIRDDVTAATPEEVLFMDPKTSASIQYCTFITTDTITCNQSAFQMFMYDASTKDQCRTAHKAIASIPEAASATHLISAYILSTGEIGWQDDGDHGLGNFLFKTMEARGVTNAIFFMTRDYGGTHIGRRRFEITQALVNNILINREAPPDRHGNLPYRIAPPPMTLPLQSTTEQWRQQRRTTQASRRSDHTSSHQDATDEAKDPSLDSTLTESKGPENMITNHDNPDTDGTKSQHDIDGTRSKNNAGNTDHENNASGPNQEIKSNGQTLEQEKNTDDNRTSAQEGKAF
jgi:hypothetical protein